MKRTVLSLILIALVATLGCGVLAGGTSDPDAIPLDVYLNRSGAFKSLTLSAPSAVIQGNFTRVQFLDTGGTDELVEVGTAQAGEFTTTGSTIGIAPSPQVPFPPTGGTGSIEMSMTSAGIAFASSAGRNVVLHGPVFIQYNVNAAGEMALPDEITELVLPASGSPASKFRLSMSGMAPNTVVQVRVGYDAATGPGTLTLTGTATNGSVTLTVSDTTPITSLTTLTMAFNAP